MSNTHQLPDLLREIQALSGDLLPAVVLSTSWPTVPVPPSLTFAAFATRGYVKDGTTLIYVDQPAHALSLGSSDGQYWLALFRDTSTPVSGWARQPGTHYILNSGASQPATPAGALLFASAIVSGGAITSVTPLPGVMGNPPAWRGHLGLGTMATQHANAVAITGGTATGLSTVAVTTDANNSAYYTDRNASAARYAVNATGTAPSYFGGTVQVAGNVGIGTAPSGQRLEVAGPTTLTGAVNLLGVVYANNTLQVVNSVAIGEAPVGHRLQLLYNRASVNGLVITPSADTGPGTTVVFNNAARAAVGSISTTGSATAYNTSSDRRLKADVQDLRAARETTMRLRPVRFRWKADGSPGVGFVADEVQALAPEAVTGEAEAVDAAGHILPQGMDLSKLVPYLVGCCQELAQQLETLTARLATLEAAARP